MHGTVVHLTCEETFIHQLQDGWENGATSHSSHTVTPERILIPVHVTSHATVLGSTESVSVKKMHEGMLTTVAK